MSDVANRLNEYYPFSPTVVDEVAEFAERQASYGAYQEFFDAVGVEEPEVVQYDGYKPVSILDIRPRDHDRDEALVVHLPMANPLDPNQIYQVATIAGTNPDKRVIAAGNPSGPGFNTGLLTHEQRQAVVAGDHRPLVDPLLKYLDEQEILVTDEYGYSYGATKLAASAAHADYAVDKAVALEPVVGKRRLLKLGSDFASTARELERYVKASDMPTFEEARSDSVGAMSYNLGLARLTNVAVARALAQGDFKDRMDEALQKQEHMAVSIVWGTESELATNGLMQTVAYELKMAHGEYRVEAIDIDDHKHALANDVHLQAAVVLEGMRRHGDD